MSFVRRLLVTAVVVTLSVAVAPAQENHGAKVDALFAEFD